MIYAVALASVLLNASAQIFLRKTALEVDGFSDKGMAIIKLVGDVVTNKWMMLGLICYALSIAIWVFVLSKIEVSSAYPLLSVGYVVTAVIGYMMFGEQFTTYKVFGIACICVGVLFITRSA